MNEPHKHNENCEWVCERATPQSWEESLEPEIEKILAIDQEAVDYEVKITKGGMREFILPKLKVFISSEIQKAEERAYNRGFVEASKIAESKWVPEAEERGRDNERELTKALWSVPEGMEMVKKGSIKEAEERGRKSEATNFYPKEIKNIEDQARLAERTALTQKIEERLTKKREAYKEFGMREDEGEISALLEVMRLLQD